MIGAWRTSMVDVIIRTYKGEALQVHFRSPSCDPPPGADTEGFGAVLVAGAPELVPVADILDIFKDIDHSAPRFVWTWEDFLRRVPPGRALTVGEAGRLVGMAPCTIRKYASRRMAPAHFGPRAGLRPGGESPCLFNEHDLRWFVAHNKPAMGRPKKSKSADGEADGV